MQILLTALRFAGSPCVIQNATQCLQLHFFWGPTHLHTPYTCDLSHSKHIYTRVCVAGGVGVDCQLYFPTLNKLTHAECLKGGQPKRVTCLLGKLQVSVPGISTTKHKRISRKHFPGERLSCDT